MACVTGEDFGQAMARCCGDFDIDKPLAEVLDPAVLDRGRPDDARRRARPAGHGFRCALATNQQNLRGAYMRGSLGFEEVFDEQFYSWELGLAKPDRATSARSWTGSTPAADHVLFLDDNAANVAGARAAGLQAELFPRDGGLAALTPILARHGIEL